jgi:hypothetical protein
MRGFSVKIGIMKRAPLSALVKAYDRAQAAKSERKRRKAKATKRGYPLRAKSKRQTI